MSCRDCNIKKNRAKLDNVKLMAPYNTKAHLRAKCVIRQTRIKNQFSFTADRKKILEFYKLAQKMTEETGIPYEVDHIKPLSKGGLHHQDNLQVITGKENRRKGSKYETAHSC